MLQSGVDHPRKPEFGSQFVMMFKAGRLCWTDGLARREDESAVVARSDQKSSVIPASIERICHLFGWDTCTLGTRADSSEEPSWREAISFKHSTRISICCHLLLRVLMPYDPASWQMKGRKRRQHRQWSKRTTSVNYHTYSFCKLARKTSANEIDKRKQSLPGINRETSEICTSDSMKERLYRTIALRPNGKYREEATWLHRVECFWLGKSCGKRYRSRGYTFTKHSGVWLPHRICRKQNGTQDTVKT